MPTHTPGPWRWDYVLLRGANDAVVVDVSTNPCGPSVDDARLIAAAPELLAALKDCVATLGGRSANPDAIPASARAAIAKVEGGLKS